jgi:hypothetical protein
METIIKKAIEGGYQPLQIDEEHGISKEYVQVFCLMTPAFWKSLGNACGWKYIAYKNGQWKKEETDLSVMSDTPFRSPEWQWNAMHFHELLLTDGWPQAVSWLTNQII